MDSLLAIPIFFLSSCTSSAPNEHSVSFIFSFSIIILSSFYSSSLASIRRLCTKFRHKFNFWNWEMIIHSVEWMWVNFNHILLSWQVINSRNMLQHSNMSEVAAPTIVYTSSVHGNGNRLNSVSNSQSQQRQQSSHPSTSSLATFTISSNVSSTPSNGNDQESPLLSFCSVTNTLLNE